MVQTAVNDKKTLLYDVVIVRPLAIVLLVLYHAFIIYMGGWREPAGFISIEPYWWIAKSSYAFMLELFVFISGYVFALSLQKREQTFRQIVTSKFKRLIIPSIVFSIAYYLIFYDLHNFNPVNFTISVISGSGHMWFLPMLFWVILLCYVIDKIRIPGWLKIVGVCMLPVLSILPIPLRINSALYYILYFYFGFLIYRFRDEIISRYSKHLTTSILLGGIFCVVFITGTILIRDTVILTTSLIVKACVILVQMYIKIVYALCGIAFTYLFVNYFVSTKGKTPPEFIVKLNRSCFGIYLFQQFILQALYYKTNLPVLVGAYWLPWVGFVVALLGSYLLTRLLLLSKIGRQLV
jgi:surface polysaccharide O-acyltransferase-like enzyme